MYKYIVHSLDSRCTSLWMAVNRIDQGFA